MIRDEEYYKKLHKREHKDSKVIGFAFLAFGICIGSIVFGLQSKIVIDESKITDTTIITKDNDTMRVRLYNN